MKQFIFSLFLGLAIVAVLVIPQSFSATGGQLILAQGPGLPPTTWPGGKLMLAQGPGLPPTTWPGGKLTSNV